MLMYSSRIDIRQCVAAVQLQVAEAEPRLIGFIMGIPWASIFITIPITANTIPLTVMDF
jgi:hypothetical protein